MMFASFLKRLCLCSALLCGSGMVAAQAVGPLQVGGTTSAALPGILQNIQQQQSRGGSLGAFVTQGDDPSLQMPVMALVSPHPVPALGGMKTVKIGHQGGLVRFIRLGGEASAGSVFFANLARQVSNTRCADHLASDELTFDQRDMICVTPQAGLWMRSGGSEIWVADRALMRRMFEAVLADKEKSRLYRDLESSLR